MGGLYGCVWNLHIKLIFPPMHIQQFQSESVLLPRREAGFEAANYRGHVL